ncbi:tetratricopeptide repeat protein [Thiohalophilus sp.]|uniref:tetratricopeptide repeat protein n=1 Tax=Thiohalophilus sp. TaxID=3028392 RepID=UPI002ACD73B7|nr:tetratricopeptide repeat protein [Thiohalophilus sp.]MDZ7803938.1 tetratricopeptide repeat protein [Thiohalophilus sp.]
MKNPIYVMCLALLLPACQTAPTPGAPDDTPESAPVTSEPVAQSEAPAPVAELPESLSGEVLYYLLAAEIALQRNRMDVAVEGYSKAAAATNDVRVAERAARIAVYARDDERALQAAQKWVQLAPDNAEARQVLAALLVRTGNSDAALPHFEALLALDNGDKERQRYMLITSLLSKEKDKQAALAVMQKLVAERRDNPDAQYALAHLALMVDSLELAGQAIEQALARRPDWSDAHLLRANVLHRQGKTGRLFKLVRERLDTAPDDVPLRLFLARKLVDEQQFDAARRQFDEVLKREPGHTDALYARGLLALQMGDYTQAEASFKQLIAQKRRVNEARYYLGQAAELQEKFDLALDYYAMIERGDQYVNARIRAAGILAKQGGLAAGREHLQNTRADNLDTELQLYLAEGDLLLNAREYEEAYRLYNIALEQMPDNSKLLYARALVAEKLDRLDETIADLQRIVNNEPNNAEALNALGYTLVDATDRIDEGFDYIRRAYKIQPDEPAIIDSMGWAYYRLGQHDKALEYLQRAFDKLRDGEIAAHLGEVLWVTGRREDARRVWDEALREAPEHRVLQDVIERFTQ